MIRLNLGCGDKILENYINVDVASERKGKKPDVISDIRKLTFDDNYADEILSVHVIEHFSYHTGQITTLTKWLTNKDTSFYSGVDLNKLNQYRNLN